MIFGSVDYEVCDANSTEIYRLVMKRKLPVSNMCSKKGKLTLTVAYELSGAFESLLDDNGIEFTVIRKRGLCYILGRLMSKKGLLVGSAVSVLVLWLLSGYVFSFEILNDSPETRQEIMNVLTESGVSAGKSISDTDLTVVERALKQKVSGISWAGISVKGCKMIIDTVDTIPKPEYTQTRLPTNLIARENGVIEKVELIDGMLVKTVGSGVAKGDLIVSGEVVTDRVYYKNGEELHDIHQRYARSIGKIYGTFERSFKVTQPYSKSVTVLSGKKSSRSLLSIFDADIPLYFSGQDSYSCRSRETAHLSIFGIDLPLSVTTEELEEYRIEELPLSELEAIHEARLKAEAYEKNFLGEFEIKDRKFNEKVTDSGIVLTVTYTLYGEISEEVEFFVDK